MSSSPDAASPFKRRRLFTPSTPTPPPEKKKTPAPLKPSSTTSAKEQFDAEVAKRKKPIEETESRVSQLKNQNDILRKLGSEGYGKELVGAVRKELLMNVLWQMDDDLRKVPSLNEGRVGSKKNDHQTHLITAILHYHQALQDHVSPARNKVESASEALEKE